VAIGMPNKPLVPTAESLRAFGPLAGARRRHSGGVMYRRIDALLRDAQHAIIAS
jgi:hypothetical protein